MSGHSKWSKVKHQKAVTDVVKSREFTKASRAITVAVKEGGGIDDPEKNFRLRLAVDMARSVNMPKDTIERAIAKGKGDTDGSVQTIVYEGFGPGTVAYLVETVTDNPQRTGANMKHILQHAGGALAGPGAVSYQFDRCSVVVVEKSPENTYDTVLDAALRAEAMDVVEKSDVYEVYGPATGLAGLKNALTDASFSVVAAEQVLRPKQTIQPPEEIRSQNMELMEKLESLDDVQHIFTNMIEGEG